MARYWLEFSILWIIPRLLFWRLKPERDDPFSSVLNCNAIWKSVSVGAVCPRDGFPARIDVGQIARKMERKRKRRMQTPIVQPRRSFIFTPGLKPEMFPKALASGADMQMDMSVHLPVLLSRPHWNDAQLDVQLLGMPGIAAYSHLLAASSHQNAAAAMAREWASARGDEPS